MEYGIVAFKKLNSEKLIWIIIGDGELRKSLAHKIAENNLTDKVFLVGYMRDASRLLMAGDVFLLPFIKEGLPYVLLEAERAELPIVETSAGGIPEYFSQGTNIIIQPRSSDEIFFALQKML